MDIKKQKIISFIPVVNMTVTIICLATTCITQPINISQYFKMLLKFFVLFLLPVIILIITSLTIHSETLIEVINCIAMLLEMFLASRLSIIEQTKILKK